MAAKNAQHYEIGLSTIFIGMHTCMDKAIRLLDDGIMLIDSGKKIDQFGRNWHVSHSLGLYLFAIEEYGKALKLKDSLSDRVSEGIYKVDKAIFVGNKAHEIKFERAYNSLIDLPENCRVKDVGINVTVNSDEYGRTINLTRKAGSISIGSYMTGLFTLEALADSKVREKCFYIGYDEPNGEWDYELTTDGNKLKETMTNFRNHLSSLREPLYEEFKRRVSEECTQP